MNCRPGHHHHHHGHHHHDRHRKRTQRLAWFGVVIIVTILAFCGLALILDSEQQNAPELPTAPIVVNPPVVELPPDVAPPEFGPPAVSGGDHHRRHRWHHDRRHNVLGNDQWHRCLPPTISGYDSNGDVIAIPNPDCR